MEDRFLSITQNVIAQVVDEKDKYLKDVIIEYAQKQSKLLGEEIEVLFIDKSIADKIIELGVKEYLKQESKLDDGNQNTNQERRDIYG